jgi:hypothetical protein
MIKYLTGLYKIARLIAINLYRGFLNPTIKNVKKEGDICYILGNGPSLSADIIKNNPLLKTNSLFVVNFFANSDQYVQLKPKYYVLADPAFWEKNVNERLEENVELIFKTLKEKTNWEINIIVPYLAAAKLKERFKESVYLKVYYFNNMTLETDMNIDNFVYSKAFGSPLIQNVLVSAIFNALLIGFKEINLLGADHSWIEELAINEHNEVCILDKHFYDKPSSVTFTPWKKRNGEVYKMHEILVDLSKMFSGYHKLKHFALYEHAEIYNCTENSYIDAFQRKIL